MAELPPQPPGLHGVHLVPGRLSLRRQDEYQNERMIDASLFITFLSMAVLIATTGIASLIVTPALWWFYGLIAGAFMAVVVVFHMAVLRLSRRAKRIEVHNGVLRVGQHRHDVPASTKVHLTGLPGGVVDLRIGNLSLRRFPDADDAWTYDAIGWLGRAFAERLDRVLVDERPLHDWRAWEANPGRRSRLRLKWMHERSRHHFPRYHACAPVDPAGLKWTHEGVRFLVPTLRKPRRFMLSATHIHIDGNAYPLTALKDVRVVFKEKRREQGKAVIGTLQMGMGGGIFCMGVSEKVRRHGQLLWIAKQIRRAIQGQRAPDTGTEEDVPAALRSVRARARAPE